jgi:hypothetical protein
VLAGGARIASMIGMRRILIVLLAFTGQVAASPVLHPFVMTTSEAVVPGPGVGVELIDGRNAVEVDASIVGLPICFGTCEWFYGAGTSAAYRRQITDRFFVGLRYSARYWPAYDGWMRAGFLEVGVRRTSSSLFANGAIGGGISVWPDHGYSPMFEVRMAFGR